MEIDVPIDLTQMIDDVENDSLYRCKSRAPPPPLPTQSLTPRHAP